MTADITEKIAAMRHLPSFPESVMKGYQKERLGMCPAALGETNLGIIIGELYPRAAGIAARWAEQMQELPPDACEKQQDE
jgi:hypothetical protein